jgi:hypothetical protein
MQAGICSPHLQLTAAHHHHHHHHHGHNFVYAMRVVPQAILVVTVPVKCVHCLCLAYGASAD